MTSLDHQDYYGRTALMYAADEGDLQTVAELLAQGADLDIQDYGGNTAEWFAKQRGHNEVAALLYAWKQHQDINKVMIQFAQDGDNNLLRCMIQCGADINYTDEDGWSGFHWAAGNGHLNAMRTFLQCGVDIDSKGFRNWTALNQGVYWNQLGIVCELLERGADTEPQNNTLYCAAVEDQVFNSALQHAEEYGHDAIKLVLDINNIDVENNKLRIAEVLTTATENGNFMVVSKLMERGVNPDLYQNNSGETCLLIAARTRQRDLVRKLLTHSISSYDPTSIELKINNIYKYTFSDFCEEDLLKDEEVRKFHMRENADGVTLLEAIVTLKLVKEQEQVIDILMAIDKKIYPVDREDAEFRATEEIKKSIPTSEGLKNILESLGSRFPWGSGKMWCMILLSIFTMLSTMLFFGLDVTTDLQFGFKMRKSAKNMTNDINITECNSRFMETFANVTENCIGTKNDVFDSESCKILLKKSLDILDDDVCKERGNRFEDNPIEWILTSVISHTHVALSLVVAIITCIVLEWGQWRITSIFRVPLPIFTLPHKVYCEYKIFEIIARPDRNNDAKTKKKYEEDREVWRKKLDYHKTIVNLSKIIESAVESGFQFFFQTVFSLPTFILNVTAHAGHSWTELINWTTVSIIISFTSFAMAYYTIR